MRIPRRPNPQAKEINIDLEELSDYDPDEDYGEEDPDQWGGYNEEEDQ